MASTTTYSFEIAKLDDHIFEEAGAKVIAEHALGHLIRRSLLPLTIVTVMETIDKYNEGARIRQHLLYQYGDDLVRQLPHGGGALIQARLMGHDVHSSRIVGFGSDPADAADRDLDPSMNLDNASYYWVTVSTSVH